MRLVCQLFARPALLLLCCLLPANMALTHYEYYTDGGIQSGLSDDQPNFTLNGKNISLYSGAIHFFRVHPQYWRDRLRKLRAAGLNTVETYVPWNLHQPEVGLFDFGDGGTEFEEFLDIVRFIQMAKEEDLFVIVRPGPYICAEWEFGGLPSWLLRYPDMKIRTSDVQFVKLVENYYVKLLALLAPLQFTKGGPIIAFQIENEYGNTDNKVDPVDTKYLETIKNIMITNGINELFFTSDTPSNGFTGTIPGVLATANFQDGAKNELTLLKNFQPNKPLMVMEYWSGWFDHWTNQHQTRTVTSFTNALEEIIKLNSSFNLYMFHGGTNWGLLNGANIGKGIDNAGYSPDTTSYDYDAPLSENGDYTEKYHKLKELVSKHSNIKFQQPEEPALVKRVAYPSINVIPHQLSLGDLIAQNDVSPIESPKLMSMENLNINNNSGQSYGYIVYRKTNVTIASNSTLKIEGRICDSIMVLINGELVSPILEESSDLNNFGYWNLKDSTLNLGANEYKSITLDLVVENWGRNNYGLLDQFNQKKGLWQGDVLINNEVLTNFQIIPLQFKKEWVQKLTNWKDAKLKVGPTLYKATLNIDEVKDTYIDTRNWKKGIIIVNGFKLARYARVGPQQCAYLPAPILKKGDNEILIFEHFTPGKVINFATDPVFETL
ncbi:unnamed protein product [Brassicogethes aeneus]|uniref:Beta-galactosidase n=1 Tax=Brassicogethes aeneus TaxID=1431903 RepID=A0A9P0FEY1_BRAAE|nr:unnamed protein product [Brassicogethes aeneus]